MSRKSIASQVVCAAVLLGCSSARIHELYHFPGMRGDEIVNYYRVEVLGSVYGTQLRYLSGLFDEEALDRYFNTFSQPAGGAVLPQPEPLKKSGSDQPPPTGETRSPDPSGNGRKLVLLLSQNSEAIAEQIGNIAQGEAFATIVGRLLFKDQLAAAVKERSEADRLEAFVTSAKADAKAVAALLEQNQTNAADELLMFVNRIAAGLGVPPFLDFVAAAEWLHANRVALVGGEQ